MTAPAGSISLAQEHLRQTLAHSASWQAECNCAGDAAAAAERIYPNGLPKPENGETHTKQELQSYRPYAIVYTAEKDGFRKTADAGGTHFYYNPSGQLMVRINREAPEAAGDEPTADANNTFLNLLGKILDEMCDLAGTAGKLAIQSLSLDCYGWAEPNVIETQGLWQEADLTVQH